ADRKGRVFCIGNSAASASAKTMRSGLSGVAVICSREEGQGRVGGTPHEQNRLVWGTRTAEGPAQKRLVWGTRTAEEPTRAKAARVGHPHTPVRTRTHPHAAKAARAFNNKVVLLWYSPLLRREYVAIALLNEEGVGSCGREFCAI